MFFMSAECGNSGLVNEDDEAEKISQMMDDKIPIFNEGSQFPIIGID